MKNQVFVSISIELDSINKWSKQINIPVTEGEEPGDGKCANDENRIAQDKIDWWNDECGDTTLQYDLQNP